MTMFTAPQSVPFGAYEIFEMTNKRPAILNAVLEWNARRVTRKAVASLSVSLMDDIGLTGGYRGDQPVHFGRI